MITLMSFWTVRRKTFPNFLASRRRELNEAEQISAVRLLEMQRHAMLMFTSCGWFFDEISGIETVQVIQYAARALQLATNLAQKISNRAFWRFWNRRKATSPKIKMAA